MYNLRCKINCKACCCLPLMMTIRLNLLHRLFLFFVFSLFSSFSDSKHKFPLTKIPEQKEKGNYNKKTQEDFKYFMCEMSNENSIDIT